MKDFKVVGDLVKSFTHIVARAAITTANTVQDTGLDPSQVLTRGTERDRRR